MDLKKSKQDIINEMQARMYSFVSCEMSNIGYNMRYMNVDQIQYKLAELIAKSVVEGTQILLDEMYTNQEFERDLTLGP